MLPRSAPGVSFGPRVFRAALAGLGVVLLAASPAHSAPPGANPIYKQKGWWDSRFEWGTTAVHMALLRGTDTQSQIVWWYGGPDFRVWRCNAFDSLSVSSNITDTPTDGSQIHCAGLSTMADGNLFVSGGTDGPTTGLDRVNLFNRVSHNWAPDPPPMEYGRCYPTNTALGDGTVLVTGGRRHQEIMTFGGRDSAGVGNGIFGIGLRSQSSVYVEAEAVDTPPLAREGHSAIFDDAMGDQNEEAYRPFQRMVIYGGRTAGGTALNTVWALSRDEMEVRSWTQLFPAADPDSGFPTPRYGHAAVFDPVDSSMVVFGGFRSSGTALGDVWKLYLYRGTDGEWKRIVTTGGDATLPRGNHTAVYDAVLRNVLVFGGRNGSTYKNDTWQLALSGTPAWTKLAPAGLPPTGRESHTAILDPQTSVKRMLVFGGGRPDSLFREVWALDLIGPLAWTLVETTPDPTAGLPARRTGCVSLLDQEQNYWIIMAGDTTGAAPGGLSSDVWRMALNFGGPGPAIWKRLHASLPPGGRSGLAAVFDTRWTTALEPERFYPTASIWSTLESAPAWLALYPIMFLLPSGNVLEAGPGLDTHILNLTTNLWETYPWSLHDFSPGTGVMYLPGKAMVCGGYGGVGSPEARWIDLSGDPNDASWETVASTPAFVPRAEHNLIMLPTGQVLATGGILNRLNAATAVQKPQIWDPVTHVWSDSSLLAEDPAVRDYHSTALLLPDGRILSAGGDLKVSPVDHNKYTAPMYWPPYLFTSSGALAIRPNILSVDSVLTYGSAFQVCTNEAPAIAKVTLIRSGATTHSFNQDQHYIPLAFSYPGSGSCLTVTAPSSSNIAPPGDYLLFIVRGDSVPAVAKWVNLRLGPTGTGEEPPRPPAVSLSVYPNPVRSSAALRFVLTRPGPVMVSIFDASGRRVRSIDAGWHGAGEGEVAWNGEDSERRPVAAGVYFAKLETEFESRIRKVVVSR